MSEKLLTPLEMKTGTWYKAKLPEKLGGLSYVQPTSAPYRAAYPYSNNRNSIDFYSLRVPIRARGSKTVADPTSGYVQLTNDGIGTPCTKALPATVMTRLREWSRSSACADLQGSGLGVMLGTDPEIFVVDKENKVIPAWKFLPKKPTSAPPQQFWDGFQAEWTVPPKGCLAYLTDSVQSGMKAVLTAAKIHNPDARLTWESVLPVDPKDLTTASEEHVQLGCSPSLNIYESFVPDISSGRDLPIRFAGCHIHFGKEAGYFTEERIRAGVEMADALGAVVATSILDGLEHNARRQFYGRPGEYRVSENRGRLEYRTLSSGILIHPAVFHLVVDLLRMGLRLGLGGWGPIYWDYKAPYVREALLNYDTQACRKILQTNESVLRKVILRVYGGSTADAADKTIPFIFKGLREFMDVSPGCMETFWHMTPSTYWTDHSGSSDSSWGSFSFTHTKALQAST